ncbi:MAG: AIR synthase related protein, partial [Pseudomonadota bacterium]
MANGNQEFKAIAQYCQNLGSRSDLTNLGVGDDAAILVAPLDKELLVTTDSMHVGRHFFADCDPEALGVKLINVNASDIAAMGGQCEWATISISLASYDESWIAAFSTGIDMAAKFHGIDV